MILFLIGVGVKLAKSSISQVLLKAKSCEKKGDILEAQKLYKIVLDAFPKNKKAQLSLAALNKSNKNVLLENPPQNIINEVVTFYNQGRLQFVVNKAQKLLNNYPNSFIIWNILGGGYKGLGLIKEASVAFKKVTELNPNYAGGYNNLGVALQEQGKLDEAIEALNKAINLKPDYAEALSNLGNTLKEQGKLEEAKKSYKKAISLNSNYFEAYFNMGVIFNQQNKLEYAINAYKKALVLKPDYAEAYNNIGNTFKELRNFNEALVAYKKALSIKPDYVIVYNNIGNTYQDQGKLEEAMRAYDKAKSLRPDYTEAWVNGADALEKWNKLDQLEVWLDQVNKNFKTIPSDILYFQSKLLWRKKEKKQALELISTIELANVSDNRKQGFLNLKAKCFESSKNYTKAYDCFLKMNLLAKESNIYLNSHSDKFFSNTKEQLAHLRLQSAFKSINEIDKNGQSPVFLVGFPRSGTTLMDTILRSHSNIEVAEEKATVVAAKTTLRKNGYPIIHNQIFPSGVLKEAREAYWLELQKHTSKTKLKSVYIDKLPLNLLEVPLLHQLFPNAKYILAIRHPFDTILSSWMQDFEINAAMANMIDLERIVELYCIAMETFKICSSNYQLNVHMIRYEDLLEDLKGESSSLLSFLDLNWESQMKDYRSAALKRGRINTPSYSQVSQHIYKDAKYRWINYKDYLEKYFAQIKPWIEEYGYGKI